MTLLRNRLRCRAAALAHVVQRGRQPVFIAAIGPGDLPAILGYRTAQMGFSLACQALRRPALPQAVFAAAFTTAVDQHAIGAVAQGVFDK